MHSGVHRFLQKHNISEFLALLAREHGEEDAVKKWRFAVRYCGERDWEDGCAGYDKNVEVLVAFLLNEIGLSGLRLSTTRRRREGIYFSVRDEVEREDQEGIVQGYDLKEGLQEEMSIFVSEIRFPRFFQGFEGSHAFAAENLFACLVTFDASSEQGVVVPREGEVEIAEDLVSCARFSRAATLPGD